MTPAFANTRYSPADLLRLAEDGLYELVDGVLVEKLMSSEASETAWLIGGHLFVFLRDTGAAKVYPEQSFRCFPHDTDLVRRPDLAVIVASRVKEIPREGHVTVVPDLAIEVISPTDNVYDLDQKLLDYRAAGIRLIWVINPSGRIMRVHRADRSLTELRDGDVVSGEDVLPGFSVPFTQFLPARPTAAS